jgi:glutamine synthetase
MSNQPQLIDKVLRLLAEQNTEKVKLAITDMDGILRGKLMSFEKFTGIVEKGFGFCNVVFGWDSADVAYDNSQYTGWHSGYPGSLGQ